MINIYANLVIAGKKTLDEVPENIRLAVETMVKSLLQ